MSEKAVKTIKPEKIETVKTLKKRISECSILIFTDHCGLTVAQITDLRKKLRAAKSEYTVVKNTLFKRALKESGIEADVTAQLQGTTAVLFGDADIVAPAKILYKFLKDNEKKPAVKAGIFNQQLLGQDEIERLSKLPSREELIAKAVYGIASPLYGIVNVLQGPIRKLVYALEAIKKTKG